MNATEPTYFLYSGRLFHEAALPALLAQMQRRAANDAEADAALHAEGSPDSTPQPRSEDPSPEGPEGEPVGEDEDDEDEGSAERDTATPSERGAQSKRVPGPGVPVVPEHGSPDANPIDPRVF